ncbi:hypothetical protein [Solimicrobium silvestre]|uniref:Uncharacterized protein n=1 Tax=Solimicrobium silvestre TaxID=2099400 RepID=A0A2S9GVV4_9BURK|nr:hypothetical protein [Solimicrobium silvestre]PRC91844.1 hypothetical protein S2091_3400 [Solimicrobium silvestre]
MKFFYFSISIICFGAILWLSGCATERNSMRPSTLSQSTQEKIPAASRSNAALAADQNFWDVFHNAKYDEIQPVLEQMTGAYLRDPTDPVTASHIGWLHIWRISERERMAMVTPSITDDAVLARKYFQEASSINPSDARFLGFLAASTLSEGTIHHNEPEISEGNVLMRKAIVAWPEFNLFTAGYMLSTKPVDTAEFKQGLEWQWENLSLCVGEKISRTDPDYSSSVTKITTVGPKRACWNSTVAPHNFEGFFLNMGDMLVKSGDWKVAQKIYTLAKSSPDYSSWKFAPLLEERISNAQSNITPFASNKGLMINSKVSCMACHQS